MVLDSVGTQRCSLLQLIDFFPAFHCANLLLIVVLVVKDVFNIMVIMMFAA